MQVKLTWDLTCLVTATNLLALRSAILFCLCPCSSLIRSIFNLSLLSWHPFVSIHSFFSNSKYSSSFYLLGADCSFLTLLSFLTHHWDVSSLQVTIPCPLSLQTILMDSLSVMHFFIAPVFPELLNCSQSNCLMFFFPFTCLSFFFSGVLVKLHLVKLVSMELMRRTREELSSCLKFDWLYHKDLVRLWCRLWGLASWGAWLWFDLYHHWKPGFWNSIHNCYCHYCIK